MKNKAVTETVRDMRLDDARHYLITSVNLPTVVQIIEASRLFGAPPLRDITKLRQLGADQV
jgi:hypothetical protein